ncbi:hypothetical protein D9M71_779380 [compost metagenome]
MTSAKCFLFSSSKAANFSTIATRSTKGKRAHAGNAVRAAWQACSISAAVASAPDQTVWLSTGFVFSNVVPLPCNQTPFINKEFDIRILPLD